MLKDGEKGVIIQRDKKTYAIAPHIPCGVAKPETLRKIADIAEKYGAQALKITSAERIAIVGIEQDDVDDIWSELGMAPGFAVGICVRSVKACPGTTFCKKGMRDSITIGLKLDSKYHGMNLPGKLKIGISGCPNQCAETCIKDIGLVGLTKGWKLYVGGKGGAKPRLSQQIESNLSDEQALESIQKIFDYYRENARPHQRLGSMIDKMGLDEFKTEVLAT